MRALAELVKDTTTAHNVLTSGAWNCRWDRRRVVPRARTHRRRFRNYLQRGEKLSPETLLVERAFFLTLSAPEMTVVVGGMRALNANVGRTTHGILTYRPEMLTNDFFVNLLDMATEWKPSVDTENVYEGRDRATGAAKWTAIANLARRLDCEEC